jgi:hypothetical protein
MAAYVYILVHKDKPRFKIGKAVDIAARVAQLTYDELDFTKSLALEVADEAAAFNLERALHRCFDKWRLSADDMVELEGERFTGYTEWFRAECFDKLMAFVDQNTELFDYSLLNSAQLQLKMDGATASDKPKATYAGRPRVKREITPEDIAGAKAQTQLLLPLLDRVVEHCESAEVTPIGPGARALVGTCKTEHAEAVRELLYELVDLGRYSYSLGFFAIFNGTTTFSSDKGAFQFSISHIWPDFQDDGTPWRAAGETLAGHPLPVQGWSN